MDLDMHHAVMRGEVIMMGDALDALIKAKAPVQSEENGNS
jgi:hypothetical protein